MRWKIISFLTLVLVFLGVWLVKFSSKNKQSGDDPYLWLEEVTSKKALDWVRPHNDATLNLIQAKTQYRQYEKRLKDILYAKDRLVLPGDVRHGYVYNFWQDEKNVRGLWRRMPIAQYKKDRTAANWDVLLDIDALAKKEGKNWVFHGSQYLKDDPDFCVLLLSDGGKDASVIREFNLKTRTFITDGFNVPEAKQMFGWLSRDQVLIGTDFGPGSMTTSGYPRIVKLWQRGQPLAKAKTIFEAKPTDMSAGGYQTSHKSRKLTIIEARPSFYESTSYVLKTDSALQEIKIPNTASFETLYEDYLIVLVKKDWEVNGEVFKAGSLIAIYFENIENPKPTLIWQPDETSSYVSLTKSKGFLYVNIQRNVTSELLRYRFENKNWLSEKINVPPSTSLDGTVGEEFTDDVLLTFESFLEPTTLAALPPSSLNPQVIEHLPERFDASGMAVTQHFAKSKDGTAIPYFQIAKANTKLDGYNPTLLYGYGGFEISMTPYYLETASLWLEKGGVYVLSNIRGGGEFGPRWHQAALKENRQKAFDDFIAIAEDLVSRKITNPKNLGILGGSNGGLLVGAVMTQRPDLFGAVNIQVPLLDMLRFHHLLAGASWIGEYGNPDDPAMHNIIAKYSPYQNLKPGVKYPQTLIMTSTKDDRVHPGHARKMTARLEEYKQFVLYYENIDGGHSAAANIDERIRFWSLCYTFFSDALGLSF